MFVLACGCRCVPKALRSPSNNKVHVLIIKSQRFIVLGSHVRLRKSICQEMIHKIYFLDSMCSKKVKILVSRFLRSRERVIYLISNNASKF
jgi:hypothetical protein